LGTLLEDREVEDKDEEDEEDIITLGLERTRHTQKFLEKEKDVGLQTKDCNEKHKNEPKPSLIEP